MSRAVLPKASARQLWLLTGQPDREDGNCQRAPPVDEDGASDDDEAAGDPEGGEGVDMEP